MQSKRQFLSPFSPLPEHPQQDDPLSLQEYKHTSSYPHATSPRQPQTESPFRAPSIMKSETIPQSTRQGVIPGLKHQFMIPLLSREEGTLPLSRQIEATRETLPAPRQEEPPLQSSRPPLPRRIPKRKRRGRLLTRLAAAMAVLVLVASLLFSQGNGAAGAWFADTFRTVFGPAVTAQIESWYLGITDLFHQTQYQLSGKQVSAPWTVTPAPIARPPEIPEGGTQKLTPVSMAISNISPLFSPSISGGGIWAPISMAPAPYTTMPLAVKTFIQPDSTHPYAVVTLLQFDNRFIHLHMVAGTSEPGGPRGIAGPGLIPSIDKAGNVLLAAFNGGFKYSDGQYGMMVNGVIYVPPQTGAATIAVTKSGQIIMGAWGVDPRLKSTNGNLAEWRQNASPLISNGRINPLTQDGSAWGAPVLNSSYTWRSGIGITAQGTLLYAGGDSLTAYTLAVALKAAGAVYAMQTDINPYWVRAFIYNRNSNGSLSISKLNPSMQGTGTEYLYGTERDFFYLTRFTPPPTALYPTRG